MEAFLCSAQYVIECILNKDVSNTPINSGAELSLIVEHLAFLSLSLSQQPQSLFLHKLIISILSILCSTLSLSLSHTHLQSLKSNLLRFNLTNPLNRFQLFHKFTLQWFIIGFGPCPMLLQWLDDTNLKIKTSTTYLSCNLCLG